MARPTPAAAPVMMTVRPVEFDGDTAVLASVIR
jgi:hypothetical protein